VLSAGRGDRHRLRLGFLVSLGLSLADPGWSRRYDCLYDRDDPLGVVDRACHRAVAAVAQSADHCAVGRLRRDLPLHAAAGADRLVLYALPVVLGIDIPAHVAAVLVLSLYTGAFYAEIIRGGVNSIERGQWDAARAIGMRRRQVMRHVILPQAVKRMIPPFMNQSIIQLKNTSLVSTIAVADLLYEGTIITAATYRPLEVYTMVAVIYFLVLFPLTVAAQHVERRLARAD
jgi:Binding-protein-dependent transport system inner membrane component